MQKFLEAGSNVNTWFKNQSERAMLEEGLDFIQINEQSTGGRPSIDYAINISSAKERAMLVEDEDFVRVQISERSKDKKKPIITIGFFYYFRTIF